ncbi:MAG: tRNA (adenosine(37)-N6)-threonylcarbamoyltransferase complex dimerization subunit type 1 TsaB [Deltaproteobacteria bacterium]
MPALCFDCSLKSVSVAITQNDKVLAEHFIANSENHAVSLMPLIEQVCASVGILPAQMDFFAFAIGPGAFTSLRIAAATAKGFSIALDKPLIGISSLDAIALNIKDASTNICPMIDARNGLVYTSLYEPRSQSVGCKIKVDCLIAVEAFLDELVGHTIFVGSGVRANEKLISSRMPDTAMFADIEADFVKASAFSTYAWELFAQKQFLNPISFTPIYLRTSTAEIKAQ